MQKTHHMYSAAGHCLTFESQEDIWRYLLRCSEPSVMQIVNGEIDTSNKWRMHGGHLRSQSGNVANMSFTNHTKWCVAVKKEERKLTTTRDIIEALAKRSPVFVRAADGRRHKIYLHDSNGSADGTLVCEKDDLPPEEVNGLQFNQLLKAGCFVHEYTIIVS